MLPLITCKRVTAPIPPIRSVDSEAFENSRHVPAEHLRRDGDHRGGADDRAEEEDALQVFQEERFGSRPLSDCGHVHLWVLGQGLRVHPCPRSLQIVEDSLDFHSYFRWLDGGYF